MDSALRPVLMAAPASAGVVDHPFPDSPRHAALSLIFVLLQYFGPGMMKSVLTLRTGNAWVHAFGYHAFAPHVIVDTPLVVKSFGISP